MVYQNVQSLMDKLEDIKTMAEETKPEIFCCVETWLDGSHTMKEVEIKKYKYMMKNRSDKPNRGGVGIYHKNGINMEEITLPPHNKPCKCEALWTKITSANGKRIILGVIYRSPQNGTFIEHLETDLNYLTQLNLPIIIVITILFNLRINLCI